MDSTTGTHPGPGLLDPRAPDATRTVDLVQRFRSLASERTRRLDFLLGALVLVEWSPPGAPGFLSLGLVATALIVVLASTRRPTLGLSRVPWLVPVLAGGLFFLVALSALTPDTSLYGWPRRAARLVLVVLYLLVIVSGRLHYPSLVRGMAAGLAVNAVLFYVGVAPRPYGDYLSGYLLDKNVAGFAVAAVGLLFAGLVAGSRSRALVLVGVTAVVWTTGSRTSLAALGCGMVWLLLRPRLGILGRLLLAAALAFAVRLLEVDFARVGVFADREGTDALRARIDAASLIKTNAAPWFGTGLGDAFVPLQGQFFFFHNSYWSALVEGGWILLTAYLLATVVIGVGIFRSGSPVADWAVGAEAANVVVLVCALRLGEVFGTTAAMTALAAGLLAHVAHRAVPGRQGRDDRERVPAVPVPGVPTTRPAPGAGVTSDRG